MNNIPDVKATILAKQLQDYVNNYAGDAFFADLAQRIASDAGVSYVLIGHLLPEDPSKIKTVVLVAKGKVVGNMTYSLYGTPCENVVGRNCCYFPSSVQKMFLSLPGLWHRTRQHSLDVVGSLFRRPD